MPINKNNPEVAKALEDVENGTMEARRLLISESQIVHDIRTEVFQERNIGVQEWRSTGVEYAIRYNERIYRSTGMTIADVLRDADAIAGYITTGVIPSPNTITEGE